MLPLARRSQLQLVLLESEAEPRWLFADDLNHDLTLPRPGIELDQHDLLPGPEQQHASGKRHGQRRPQQRGADVARSVVVAPAQVMAAVDPTTKIVATPAIRPESAIAPAT